MRDFILNGLVSCIIDRMKAIAYNIRKQEKEYLVKANAKKHELTFISNELNNDTLIYSLDKEALILYSVNSISPYLFYKLKEFGIKQIISRADKPNSAIIHQAREYGIFINHVHNSLTNEKKAQQIIKQLDRLLGASL